MEKDENVSISPTSTTCSTDLCRRRSDTVTGYTVDQAIEKLGFGTFQLIILLLSGLTRFAATAEVMILTVLSPAVKCQWSLSSNEEAIITTVTFVGFIIGSIFWGIMGDTFGRKKTIFGTILVTLIFSALSALKLTPDDTRIPGYPWMIFCRFGVGFGASGANLASTYFIEFLPLKKRAIGTGCVTILQMSGIIFAAALAVVVMGINKLGWHWYLGLTTIPLLFVLIFIPFVPESARFHVSNGKKKEAIQVLRGVAWFNFRSLPPGELLMSPKSGEEGKEKKDVHVERKVSDPNECGIKREDSLTGTFRGSFPADGNSDAQSLSETNRLISQRKTQIQQNNLSISQCVLLNTITRLPFLFSNGMWKITLTLCFLWTGSTWLYYGSVLLTTTMLLENPHCDSNQSEISMSNLSYTYGFESVYDDNVSNATSCKDSELDTDDYLIIMYAAAAGVPCILLTFVIIDIIGRKLTMIFNYVITMLGFCLLFICTSKAFLTFFFLIIQGFSTAVLQTLYVYTLEVYPTNIRGIGVGFVMAVSRFGGTITPYVAQVLFQTNDYATIGLYAGYCLILALVVLLLSIETSGKSLQ